jgi:hypothetical protein
VDALGKEIEAVEANDAEQVKEGTVVSARKAPTKYC